MTSKEIFRNIVDGLEDLLQSLYNSLLSKERKEQCKQIENDLDKLENLKDIEKELGIDLLTLFKALKNGIYFYGQKEEEPQDVQLRMFYEEPMLVHNYGDLTELEVYVAGYGSSWSLAKEELENDK